MINSIKCPACDAEQGTQHGSCIPSRYPHAITMYVHAADIEGRALSFYCGCNVCRNRWIQDVKI